MEKETSKEELKDATKTLLTHYGAKVFKWLYKKCPKLVNSVTTVMCCIVGGFIVYFFLGVSGQDPLEFIFGKLASEVNEKPAYVDETTSNEWSTVVHSSNDYENVYSVVDTNTVGRIDLTKRTVVVEGKEN